MVMTREVLRMSVTTATHDIMTNLRVGTTGTGTCWAKLGAVGKVCDNATGVATGDALCVFSYWRATLTTGME